MYRHQIFTIYGFSAMFNKCLIFFVCVSVLYTKSQNRQEYFDSITIHIYRDEKPVSKIRETTVTNEYQATEIIIEYENVPLLKTGTFNNLTKLKYIILKRNNIEEIEPYAFKDLPKLRIINLNFNVIKRIPENVFRHLPLSKLYLKGNGIETLSSFAFRSLTFLETLDLSSNNIKILPENLFYVTKNLRHINLNNNKLQEGPHNNNLLFGYFEEAFANNIIDELSVLDLSNNNFTVIDNVILKGIICVKQILLNNNNIRSISEYAFRDLVYLDLLDLRGNNLEVLPERILRKLDETKKIELENNPWKTEFVCKYERWCKNHNKTNTMDMNCTHLVKNS